VNGSLQSAIHIYINLDIDKILEVGNMVERIVGRKLRSEAIKTGRIPKELKEKISKTRSLKGDFA